MSAVSQRTAAAGVQTAAEASEGTGQEESTSQVIKLCSTCVHTAGDLYRSVCDTENP